MLDLTNRFNEIERALFQKLPQVGETWLIEMSDTDEPKPAKVLEYSDRVQLEFTWEELGNIKVVGNYPRDWIKFHSKVTKPQAGEVWEFAPSNTLFKTLTMQIYSIDAESVEFLYLRDTVRIPLKEITFIRKILDAT